MRTSDHFKIPKEDRLDYWSYEPCPKELIKKPLITPIHDVKNQNRLINSAMLYFSKPSHRDHGFYPDPRIPYGSYFADDIEEREKIRFGNNQIITFDINEEVDKMVIREINCDQSSRNRTKDGEDSIDIKSILKPEVKTVVPYKPHPKPYLDACQEVLIKCYNMCSIPLEYLDVDKMFDSLMKLMFGISNEFKMKELCFNYMLAAERRKWFEDTEGLKSSLEISENEKQEITRLNNELILNLREESSKFEALQPKMVKLKQFDELQEENTGLTVVNSDLTSQNGQLKSKLVDSEKRVAQLSVVQNENAELHENLSLLTIKNKNLTDKNNKTLAEKQELQHKNTQILNRTNELETERRSLIELKDELYKINSDLKVQVEERNAKIKFLEKHTETMKEKYNRDFKCDLKYFKQRINDILKENVNQTSELEKTKANINQTNYKIDGLLKDNEILRKDNNHMSNELRQKSKDIRDLQTELRRNKDVVAKYERLGGEKKACDETINQLRRDFKALQEDSQTLKDHYSKLINQNGELNRERKSTHDALCELHKEIGKLQDLNSVLKEGRNSDRTSINELNDKLRDSLKNIETFKRRNQGLENKFDVLRSKYQSLEKQFKSRNFEIQQARNSVREMTSTLYRARTNAFDEENILPVLDNKDLIFKSTNTPATKRDLLRSLANQRAIVAAEPSQSLNKNFY